MTKEELLTRLNNWNYQTPELSLIKKLIKGTDESDLDFKKALEDDIAEQIVSLLIDCYSSEDLLKWLDEHDYDVFCDYRYADVEYLSDYESLEDMKENSSAFCDGEPDCLMYNEDTGVYVINW